MALFPVRLIAGTSTFRYARIMPDTLTPEERRRCMQSIRSGDTHPELAARRFLHSHGFRYRLHVPNLAGKPDIVLPRFRTVVFVHGCFWHSHSCGRGFLPKTRQEYWMPKLENTRRRDSRAKRSLKNAGWKVITLWECELKRPKIIRSRFAALLRTKRSLRRRTREQKVSNHGI